MESSGHGLTTKSGGCSTEYRIRGGALLELSLTAVRDSSRWPSDPNHPIRCDDFAPRPMMACNHA